MQHSPPTPTLTEDLLALIGALRDRHDEDPFGNPVLSAALAISRRIDRGELPNDVLTDLVATLRDAAFADRAVRLAAYVGGLDGAEAAMTAVARRIARPDPADSPVPFSAFREAVERPRFAAVFTGHPTFALPTPVAAALAGLSGGTPAAIAVSHRPGPVTLEEEFSRAQAAITLGRDAVDTLVRGDPGRRAGNLAGALRGPCSRAGDALHLGGATTRTGARTSGGGTPSASVSA